ncbi:MAG: serine protease [Verrucomicrobia bacterium]|nr:serine protease [Alphaproteobacteria bacterium]MBM3887962.1 serine protease [Verrucomicrobiota bacterium]
MPTWGKLLEEIQQAKKDKKPPPFDAMRRRYLVDLHDYTKRAVILYATKWTQADPNIPLEMVSINDEDLQGLMEVLNGVDIDQLDLIIHSPGGSVDAAEAIVHYLRSKFSHIRVFVPQLAMSAATMIACAADEIVMGKHSFIGPTDPQLILTTGTGTRMVAAASILEQFDKAVEECKEPGKLGAWLPMLGQYGPDLLVKCEHVCDLAETLVKEWLAAYMMKNEGDPTAKSGEIASWLSDHKHFRTHARHIARSEAEERGLRIVRLEDDQKLQDLVLSAYHATTHTFNFTGAVKIIENHLGRAFINAVQVTPAAPVMPPIMVQIPHGQRPPATTPAKPIGPPPVDA